MLDQTSKFAKLLATENISVVQAPVKTASFDTESRVLTLPQWKIMNEELTTMLVGHEVGHALFTTKDMIEATRDDRQFHGYVNVLEDVRIEKMMKDRYPGLRKDFLAGYRYLVAEDFFGITDRDVNEMLLIDRINLWFKVGYQSGVKFSPEEADIVKRASRTMTPADVLALAEELYGMAKEKAEEQLEEVAASMSAEDFEEEEGDDDWDDTSPDYQEVDGDQENYDSFAADMPEQEDAAEDGVAGDGAGYRGQADVSSKTQSRLDEKLDELADTSVVYKFYSLANDYVSDPVVPFKRVLAETTLVNELVCTERFQSKWSEFMVSTNRTVGYLVKEFEMRKSAQMYKRSQISKVGSLDMKKIYSYKLNDDIFRRIMTTPQGKNHGLVFLLDWSGSMYDVIEDTVKQLIPLALFCRRIQVPFRVMAFTSEYPIEEGFVKDWSTSQGEKDGFIPTGETEFRLLELMSDRMTNSEFITMAQRLVANLRYGNRDYGMGGTPLNESLCYMMTYLPKFVKQNNIEKMTFVTLTDGDGHRNAQMYCREYNDGVRVNIKNFIQDPVTKKTYEIGFDGSQQTRTYMKMIKDRFNCTTIGFYVCRNTAYNLRWAVINNSSYNGAEAYSMLASIRKSFRDNGFYSLKGSGRDEMFVIPTNKIRGDEVELEVSEKMTAKQIARKFTKTLKGNRSSKILLDRFSSLVA